MAGEGRISSDSVTESSPLLGSGPVPAVTETQSLRAHNRRIFLLSLFVNLLASSAGGFLGIPQTRLVEDVLCHEYYGRALSLDVPIDEDLCKAEPIQSDLSYIIAMQAALIAGVSLAAAFPWSLAADRIGRKPVLSMCLSGMALGSAWSFLVLWFRRVLPVRLIWLEALGQIIGGGNPVAMGLLCSIIADVTTEEERAVAFMQQHMASVFGNLMAPSISSFMMARWGPWPPAMVGIGLITLSAAAVLFVPETLQSRQASSYNPDQDDTPRQKSGASHYLDQFKESLSILRSPSLILLLLTCLGTMPLFFSTTSFMAIFLSKRYHLRLFQGGYVQSAFGVAQMVQTLLFLPWLSRRLMQSTTPPRLRPADEHHRDLSIARWSAGIGAFAALVLGLAPTLPGFVVGLALLAIGSGCSSLLRSLMSLYVDPQHRSRLFGLVGMVEIVGTICAQPMLAGLFSLGMQLGGGWIGLPYFGLTVLVTMVTALLLFVRVPRKVEDQLVAAESTCDQDALVEDR